MRLLIGQGGQKLRRHARLLFSPDERVLEPGKPLLDAAGQGPKVHEVEFADVRVELVLNGHDRFIAVAAVHPLTRGAGEGIGPRGQIPAQVLPPGQVHGHFQVRPVPARDLDDVGVRHGAVETLFSHPR